MPPTSKSTPCHAVSTHGQHHRIMLPKHQPTCPNPSQECKLTCCLYCTHATKLKHHLSNMTPKICKHVRLFQVQPSQCTASSRRWSCWVHCFSRWMYWAFQVLFHEVLMWVKLPYYPFPQPQVQVRYHQLHAATQVTQHVTRNPTSCQPTCTIVPIHPSNATIQNASHLHARVTQKCWVRYQTLHQPTTTSTNQTVSETILTPNVPNH